MLAKGERIAQFARVVHKQADTVRWAHLDIVRTQKFENIPRTGIFIELKQRFSVAIAHRALRLPSSDAICACSVHIVFL